MRILLLVCLILSGERLRAQTLSDAALQKIAFEQKLGRKVSLDLPFRDEQGKPVHLGDYFGRKPVILDLGYYGCPMLCTAVLNGMIGGLQDLNWDMGKDYQVVNVSIDPHETSSLAAAKKASYVERFGQPKAAAGWHFLTGDEPAIQRLAAQVGFNYTYDPVYKQYAHPSGLVVLSPDGSISHYLTGVVFSTNDLRHALADAARSRTGSPVEQIFLLCFHYSPVSGKYSGVILGVVRVLGVSVVAGLAALIARARRRGRLTMEKA